MKQILRHRRPVCFSLLSRHGGAIRILSTMCHFRPISSMCSQGKTVRKGTWIPILAHIRLHLRALGIDGYDEERGMKSLLLPAANFSSARDRSILRLNSPSSGIFSNRVLNRDVYDHKLASMPLIHLDGSKPMIP